METLGGARCPVAQIENTKKHNLKQKFIDVPETTFATSGYFLLKNIK